MPSLDPFFAEFEAKYSSDALQEEAESVEWSPLCMKVRAKRTLVCLDRIAEIAVETKALIDSSTENPVFKVIKQKRMIQLASEDVLLRRRVEMDMAYFRNEHLFGVFKDRVLTSQRKQVRPDLDGSYWRHHF